MSDAASTARSGSPDPRAQAIWAAFLRDGRVADHFARTRAKFSAQPTWSLIVPVEAPGVIARAQAVQAAVAAHSKAQPISPERLHITLFTVAVEPPPDWLGELRDLVGQSGPIETSVGGVNAFPESVFLEVDPADELRRLRAKVRAAAPWIIGDVPGEFYLPHISVAYFGEEGRGDAVGRVLAAHRGLEPIPIHIGALLASRLEFDGGGRSRRLESHELKLGGAE